MDRAGKTSKNLAFTKTNIKWITSLRNPYIKHNLKYPGNKKHFKK